MTETITRELTDEERKVLYEKTRNLATQAYDLFMELGYLKEQFCLHTYPTDQPSEFYTQCVSCGHIERLDHENQ